MLYILVSLANRFDIGMVCIYWTIVATTDVDSDLHHTTCSPKMARCN